MKLKNRPMWDKLMWDAPIPFQGYYNENKNAPGRVLYPVLIGEHHQDSKPPQNEWRKVYTGKTGYWMRDSEFIREPTSEELEKYTWPTVKSEPNV